MIYINEQLPRIKYTKYRIFWQGTDLSQSTVVPPLQLVLGDPSTFKLVPDNMYHKDSRYKPLCGTRLQPGWTTTFTY